MREQKGAPKVGVYPQFSFNPIALPVYKLSGRPTKVVYIWAFVQILVLLNRPHIQSVASSVITIITSTIFHAVDFAIFCIDKNIIDILVILCFYRTLNLRNDVITKDCRQNVRHIDIRL